MPAENESPKGTPENRAVLNKKQPLVKVRVVKQPIRHEHRTYLGPRQGPNGPLPGETFHAPADRVEAYGTLVEPAE